MGVTYLTPAHKLRTPPACGRSTSAPRPHDPHRARLAQSSRAALPGAALNGAALRRGARQVLARRYSAEEQAVLQAQSPAKPRGGAEGGAEGPDTAAWLQRIGLDLAEWGLGDGPSKAAGGPGDEADPLGDVERIVARLKAPA